MTQMMDKNIYNGDVSQNPPYSNGKWDQNLPLDDQPFINNLKSEWDYLAKVLNVDGPIWEACDSKTEYRQKLRQFSWNLKGLYKAEHKKFLCEHTSDDRVHQHYYGYVSLELPVSV